MVMALILFPLTFVMSLDRTNIVVSAPIIQKQFHFTLFQMSLILTSFAWTYSFLQIPGGLLAERYGARKLLTWANGWWSLFTILTPLGFSVGSFVAIRGLLGLGQAADWPSSVYAIRRWFPDAERAKANSILLGGLYLGPIIGAPLTVFIVKSLGWQWAFYIYGAAGVITAVAWWRFFRDRPEQMSEMSTAEAEYIRRNTAIKESEESGPRAWRRFIGSLQFWSIGIQYFLLILIQSFFTIWLPTYLIKARHFSLTQMGWAASLPWVALFVMVFVTGQAADRVYRRTNSKWAARVPFAMSGFIISAAFLIIASRVVSPVGMIICLMVSLGAIGLTQVSIWSAAQDLAPTFTGSLTGWTNFWGNFASALGPIFTALLVGLTSSWTAALLVMALAGALGAILWIFVHPERPLTARDEPSTISQSGQAQVPAT
ncbi:MAG: MFS transporter [Chloroflexi bacterium]|nr:MFS transporter [Chloroflexota bacterium]